jgi:hypothetical protein
MMLRTLRLKVGPFSLLSFYGYVKSSAQERNDAILNQGILWGVFHINGQWGHLESTKQPSNWSFCPSNFTPLRKKTPACPSRTRWPKWWVLGFAESKSTWAKVSSETSLQKILVASLESLVNSIYVSQKELNIMSWQANPLINGWPTVGLPSGNWTVCYWK